MPNLSSLTNRGLEPVIFCVCVWYVDIFYLIGSERFASLKEQEYGRFQFCGLGSS